MRSYLQFQKNQSQVRARKKTEHLNDIRQDASGNWVYEGEWMECTLSAKERRRVICGLWCLLILAAACCIVCGCIRGTGMEGCFYVLIPYASSVFAACLCVRHLFAVSAGKGRMWKHHHTKHMLGLGPCLIWGIISSILCVARLRSREHPVSDPPDPVICRVSGSLVSPEETGMENGSETVTENCLKTVTIKLTSCLNL